MDKRKMRGKVLWPVVIVVALVALGGLATAWLGAGGAPVDYGPVTEVRRGDLTISVTESGTLRNRDQRIVSNEVEGRTTILWIIDEGEEVEAGDLLVELDSSDLEDRLVEREISVQTAEADYIRAREQLAVTKSQNETNIAQAELDLRFARSDLAKYLEGEYQQQLERLRADIAIAEGDMNRAQTEYNWSQTLAEEGFITEMELMADRLSYQRAQLDHSLSETSLELFEQYTHHRDLDQLESDVEQAERALERVKLSANSDLVQAEASYEARKQELERQRRQLTRLEEQIEKCEIRAPAAGMVVYETSANQSRRGNTEPLEAGQEVRERQELIYLPASDGMVADVTVHESALDRIEPGMEVRIQVDARPGQVFPGTVRRIAPMPDAQSLWLNPDLTVYSTQIDVDAQGLRTGMSCQAEIIIDELDDVLYVPVQSVVRAGGRHYAYVVGPAGPQPRQVEIGYDNNRQLHIRSGLEEGERVLLAPPLTDEMRREREEVEEDDAEQEQDAGAQPSPQPGGERPQGGRGEGGRGGGAPGGGGGGGGAPGGGGGRPGGQQ